MRRMFRVIDRVARSEATVLILGETGTGKELVADALHRCSPRHDGPLAVLDCSAIPASLVEAQLFGYQAGAFTGAVKDTPGMFEAAHRGTLFLDEIGELPLAAQAKLLRAVETRTVRRLGGTAPFAADVRLVAATNRELAAEVRRGRFRRDLFYRLAVARIDVPPLRERREDVPALVEHFVRELVAPATEAEARLPGDFLPFALRHAWPGNVRELRNAVERALLLETHVGFEVVPYDAPEAPEIDLRIPFRVAKQQIIDAFEGRYLRALLDAHGGNITAAARAAGLDRVSIYKMIRRLGFDIDGDAAGGMQTASHAVDRGQ
jgi:transcriptional regulator with PAS, ATPase and Fis domain